MERLVVLRRIGAVLIRLIYYVVVKIAYLRKAFDVFVLKSVVKGILGILHFPMGKNSKLLQVSFHMSYNFFVKKTLK